MSANTNVMRFKLRSAAVDPRAAPPPPPNMSDRPPPRPECISTPPMTPAIATMLMITMMYMSRSRTVPYPTVATATTHWVPSSPSLLCQPHRLSLQHRHIRRAAQQRARHDLPVRVEFPQTWHHQSTNGLPIPPIRTTGHNRIFATRPRLYANH